MTENELRQKVADIINAWVGATKGTAKHLDILEVYNNYRPLARGYKVQVNDAYCATTVSAAYIRAGIAEYTGTECGVEKYTVVAKNKGIWVENDAHTPKIGDACVYDWQDNGVGDCTGAGDHIGIVTQVSAGSFVVTEGNMSGGKVGKRTMAVNGKYIRGFICPDFAAISKKLGGTTTATTPPAAVTPSAVQGTAHTVVAGDTLGKIAARYGTTVDALAAINGIQNKNLIRVGQVIYLTEVAAAVAKLARLGVINSPDYWKRSAASGKFKYLDLLLTKAAEKITKAGTRTKTPEDGVAALVAAGVINTPDYWLANYRTFPSLDALLCALGGAVK
ncbi:MAG: LysM peptidoglycan-binding domain-containing protein [Ruminococcus flavefaciens]|nr:LysM peptidoglycan-binding domain-containing protein [Ruminococcus flavefaciens]